MAIDTEGKRRSTLDAWAFARILPVPDGTIATVDRAHLYVYSGLAVVPALTYFVEVDWNDNDVFTDANEDITGDVLSSAGVETRRGRDFASQLTGRAVAGRFVAILRNDDGKYSPFNTASPLSGNLVPGRKVRVRTTTPTAMIWTGFLDRIGPEKISGATLQRAMLEASGAIGKLSGKTVNPAANAGALTGTLIGTVLDEAGWPAGDRTIDAGQTTTGRWYIEDKAALPAIRELEETEMGFFHEGLAFDLIYEDRHHRLKADHLTSQATFSDAAGAALPYVSIVERDPLREIFNEARTTIRPATVGALAVLWTLTGETPTLAPGASREYWANYPQAADTTGLYVDAWTTPDSTDITVTGVAFSDLGISVSKFARSMKITITNNHATATATLTLVRARGTPVTADDATTVAAEDATSQSAYGERTFRLAGKWLANTNKGQDLVDYIVSRYKDPLAVVSITLVNASDALLTEILTRKISDLITIVATSSQTGPLGINETFFIEAIEHRISDGGKLHYATFHCSPSGGDQGYFILNTSKLNTGKLAY